MNRINTIFKQLRADGGKALMPFITAGDPDLATTAALLPALERAGASICEVGIPYSDPIADGPVIQASMTHALRGGVRLAGVLQAIAEQRDRVGLGLVAMVSISIVERVGTKRFLTDAADAGFDGVIFPDLPVEESDSVRAAVAEHGLVCSLLIAPTTPIDRAERIARACSGFVYLLARSGLTGEQAELDGGLPERVRRLRAVTDLPIAVGFGISTADQVSEVVQEADAAIVGSAIMKRVATLRDDGGEAVVGGVERFVEQLAGGLSRQPRPATER